MADTIQAAVTTCARIAIITGVGVLPMGASLGGMARVCCANVSVVAIVRIRGRAFALLTCRTGGADAPVIAGCVVRFDREVARGGGGVADAHQMTIVFRRAEFGGSAHTTTVFATVIHGTEITVFTGSRGRRGDATGNRIARVGCAGVSIIACLWTAHTQSALALIVDSAEGGIIAGEEFKVRYVSARACIADVLGARVVVVVAVIGVGQRRATDSRHTRVVGAVVVIVAIGGQSGACHPNAEVLGRAWIAVITGVAAGHGVGASAEDTDVSRARIAIVCAGGVVFDTSMRASAVRTDIGCAVVAVVVTGRGIVRVLTAGCWDATVVCAWVVVVAGDGSAATGSSCTGAAVARVVARTGVVVVTRCARDGYIRATGAIDTRVFCAWVAVVAFEL